MHHVIRLVSSFKANKKDKNKNHKNFLFFFYIVIIYYDWCIIRNVSFVRSYSNNFNSILTYGLLVLLRKIVDDIIEVVVVRFL